MNEVTKNELLQIENNILRLKRQAVQNIIQIGQELLKAKEKLPHGEWGEWLEERVEFSQRMANQFMRIAKEFGSNSQTISNLDASKVYLLMELPPESRDGFIAENDLDNMSTREVKAKVKDYKRNSDIWKVIDKDRDENKYEIPIIELKPLPEHEKYFGTITGIDYIDFLNSIQKYGVVRPIIITRDKTIVDGHERVRACRDLGFQTVPAVYLCCKNEKNLKLEELLLHIFFNCNMHTRSSMFYLANALDEHYFGDNEKAKYYMDKFLNEGEQIDKEMKEWRENAKKMIEEERMTEARNMEDISD